MSTFTDYIEALHHAMYENTIPCSNCGGTNTNSYTRGKDGEEWINACYDCGHEERIKRWVRTRGGKFKADPRDKDME